MNYQTLCEEIDRLISEQHETVTLAKFQSLPELEHLAEGCITGLIMAREVLEQAIQNEEITGTNHERN